MVLNLASRPSPGGIATICGCMVLEADPANTLIDPGNGKQAPGWPASQGPRSPLFQGKGITTALFKANCIHHFHATCLNRGE